MKTMTDYNKIEIQDFSTSTQEKRYLLSYNGQYYEANHSIIELLIALQEYPSEEEAISFYISEIKEGYTREQVYNVIRKFINPILFNCDTKKKRSFLYEKEIFSGLFIDRFSDKFSFLFNKLYILTFLTLTLLLDAYFFIFTENLLQLNSRLDFYTVVGLFLFMLFSSFFHELGHACGCKYYGVKHGGIGFGLYLNFPVLYTDVTEIWKLKRTQRCIVNIAGVYFQSYWLFILLFIYILTSNEIIKYLILITNFGFIMTLNPFFKFDGYWIVSDLLGVPNLRKRAKEFFVYLYKYIRGNNISTTKKPYILQINRLEKYCLLIYSTIVNLFMGLYFFYIIPTFIHKFTSTFPNYINELILYLSNRITPPFALLRNIGGQLLFIALIGYLLLNLIRPLLKRYVKQ